MSNLGILGILLVVTGGLATMSAPSRMISRADVSRTTVQEMQSMRSGPNSWFGIGLSLFLSGLILGIIAVIYVRTHGQNMPIHSQHVLPISPFHHKFW